jgi:hypothetical protein
MGRAPAAPALRAPAHDAMNRRLETFFIEDFSELYVVHRALNFDRLARRVRDFFDSSALAQ